MYTAQKFVEGALHAEVRKCLAACTERQRGLFAQAYRQPIDDLPEDELRSALNLCYRTLKVETALFGMFEPGLDELIGRQPR